MLLSLQANLEQTTTFTLYWQTDSQALSEKTKLSSQRYWKAVSYFTSNWGTWL